MWEYEPELDRLGTPMALMLLPYWTDDCIAVDGGLVLRVGCEHPVPLPQPVGNVGAPITAAARPGYYESLNVAAGVKHLQQLGVRYYMAVSTRRSSRPTPCPTCSSSRKPATGRQP